jgi:hypothetical protein
MLKCLPLDQGSMLSRFLDVFRTRYESASTKTCARKLIHVLTAAAAEKLCGQLMLKSIAFSALMRRFGATLARAFRRSGRSEDTEDSDMMEAESLEERREKMDVLFVAGMVRSGDDPR